MERSLLVIKPDGLRRQLAVPIFQMVREAGLQIARQEVVKVPYKLAMGHLSGLTRELIARNLLFYLSGPLAWAVIRGPGCVARLRELCGATDPALAAASTIRGKFRADTLDHAIAGQRALENVVHSSDSREAAAMELALWEAAFRPGGRTTAAREKLQLLLSQDMDLISDNGEEAVVTGGGAYGVVTGNGVLRWSNEPPWETGMMKLKRGS